MKDGIKEKKLSRKVMKEDGQNSILRGVRNVEQNAGTKIN